VVGDLTVRQKMMTVKLLREAPYPAIAMDEYNAETQKLAEQAEYLIIFDPGDSPILKSSLTKLTDPNAPDVSDPEVQYFSKMKRLGWSISRILVEEDNFEEGELPKF
jgi:hypothetical protein